MQRYNETTTATTCISTNAYVSLAYAVGCWGRTRKIGFGLAFVLSLVNLLVGIIAVACSKKLDNVNNKEENV